MKLDNQVPYSNASGKTISLVRELNCLIFIKYQDNTFSYFGEIDEYEFSDYLLTMNDLSKDKLLLDLLLNLELVDKSSFDSFIEDKNKLCRMAKIENSKRLEDFCKKLINAGYSVKLKNGKIVSNDVDT